MILLPDFIALDLQRIRLHHESCLLSLLGIDNSTTTSVYPVIVDRLINDLLARYLYYYDTNSFTISGIPSPIQPDMWLELESRSLPEERYQELLRDEEHLIITLIAIGALKASSLSNQKSTGETVSSITGDFGIAIKQNVGIIAQMSYCLFTKDCGLFVQANFLHYVYNITRFIDQYNSSTPANVYGSKSFEILNSEADLFVGRFLALHAPDLSLAEEPTLNNYRQRYLDSQILDSEFDISQPDFSYRVECN